MSEAGKRLRILNDLSRKDKGIIEYLDCLSEQGQDNFLTLVSDPVLAAKFLSRFPQNNLYAQMLRRAYKIVGG